MDSMWWIVIAVVAAVVVIALIAMMARKKAAARTAERNRHRAGELRQEARLTGVDASRREAEAATARADAQEARLAAEQLEREAKQHERRAGEVRSEVDERLVEADKLDPDSGRATSHGSHELRADDDDPMFEEPQFDDEPATHDTTGDDRREPRDGRR